MEGLVNMDSYGHRWDITGLSQWVQYFPWEEGRKSSSYTIAFVPPHIRMIMANGCRGKENGLLMREIRAIVTTIYNRMYQPRHKKESIFPVSIHQRNLTEVVKIDIYNSLGLAHLRI